MTTRRTSGGCQRGCQGGLQRGGMLTVWDILLRMALKEFLNHSKESWGVLGQASKQALKRHSFGAMPCRGLLREQFHF